MNDAVWWLTAAAFAIGMVLPWWQARRRIRQRLRSRLSTQRQASLHAETDETDETDETGRGRPANDLQNARKSAQS